MVNFAKLNKTLKQLERDGVLVGPRATRGSYGDIANIMQASLDKRLEIEKKQKGRKKRRIEGQKGRRRGLGIAVKGGGIILWKILKTNSQE